MTTCTNAFMLLADQRDREASSIIALKTAELKKTAENKKKFSAEKKKPEAKKKKNKNNKAKDNTGDKQANQEQKTVDEHSRNQNQSKASVRAAVHSQQDTSKIPTARYQQKG